MEKAKMRRERGVLMSIRVWCLVCLLSLCTFGCGRSEADNGTNGQPFAEFAERFVVELREAFEVPGSDDFGNRAEVDWGNYQVLQGPLILEGDTESADGFLRIAVRRLDERYRYTSFWEFRFNRSKTGSYHLYSARVDPESTFARSTGSPQWVPPDKYEKLILFAIEDRYRPEIQRVCDAVEAAGGTYKEAAR